MNIKTKPKKSSDGAQLFEDKRKSTFFVSILLLDYTTEKYLFNLKYASLI